MHRKLMLRFYLFIYLFLKAAPCMGRDQFLRQLDGIRLGNISRGHRSKFPFQNYVNKGLWYRFLLMFFTLTIKVYYELFSWILAFCFSYAIRMIKFYIFFNSDTEALFYFYCRSIQFLLFGYLFLESILIKIYRKNYVQIVMAFSEVQKT